MTTRIAEDEEELRELALAGTTQLLMDPATGRLQGPERRTPEEVGASFDAAVDELYPRDRPKAEPAKVERIDPPTPVDPGAVTDQRNDVAPEPDVAQPVQQPPARQQSPTLAALGPGADRYLENPSAGRGPSDLSRNLAEAQRQGMVLGGIGLLGRFANGMFGSRRQDGNFQGVMEMADRPARDVLQRHEAEQSERSADLAERNAQQNQQRLDLAQSATLAQRDPSSPASRAAQQAFAPLAQRFGLTPDDVGNMSAQQVERLMGPALGGVGQADRQQAGFAQQNVNREDTQVHQREMQEARLSAAENLARLRAQLSQAQRRARGGGPGARVAATEVQDLTSVVDIARRLRDPAQDVTTEELVTYQNYMARADTGARQGMNQIAESGHGRDVTRRAAQGRTERLERDARRAELPTIQAVLPQVQQGMAQVPDTDLVQDTLALRVGPVPSSGNPVMQKFARLRQLTLRVGAGLAQTNTELQAIDSYIGSRSANVIDPRRLRRMYMTFFETLAMETAARQRSLERGAGQDSVALDNAPVEHRVDEPGVPAPAHSEDAIRRRMDEIRRRGAR